MADYWKSQDRKYCEFCHCWIADNKPSVQFHEGGKRHKDAVAKRLSLMQRKSAKQQKANAKLEYELRKMEDAALKAYMTDIQLNPDVSSAQVAGLSSDSSTAPSELQLIEASRGVKRVPITTYRSQQQKKWYEVRSEDGSIYFWNIQNNETTWKPPDEDWVTLEDQEGDSNEPQQGKKSNNEYQEELRAWRAREELKKYRRPDIRTEEEMKNDVFTQAFAPLLEPTHRHDPYGGWKAVKPETKKVNLQLPQQEVMEIRVPPVAESQLKIKEKKVVSLTADDDTPTTFKKRKLNANRGTRQRLDDEED